MRIWSPGRNATPGITRRVEAPASMRRDGRRRSADHSSINCLPTNTRYLDTPLGKSKYSTFKVYQPAAPAYVREALHVEPAGQVTILPPDASSSGVAGGVKPPRPGPGAAGAAGTAVWGGGPKARTTYPCNSIASASKRPG